MCIQTLNAKHGDPHPQIGETNDMPSFIFMHSIHEPNHSYRKIQRFLRRLFLNFIFQFISFVTFLIAEENLPCIPLYLPGANSLPGNFLLLKKLMLQVERLAIKEMQTAKSNQ